MAESSCLLRSFSCGTPITHETDNQGNHGHVLGDSITFGRFMSESLPCEKWSSAPQKRYVEEARSYTQPGSVAQKKAFFEAYYKRLAAQKAAAEALLEQEKAAATTTTTSQVSDFIQSIHDSETTKAKANAKASSHDCVEAVLKFNSLLANDNSIVAANTKNTESLNSNENLEDHVSVSVSISVDRTSQTERPLLKSKSNSDEEVTQPKIKGKPAISSLVSSVSRKSSRIPLSPSKDVASVHHGKANISTPRTKNFITIDNIDKSRTTPKLLKVLSSSFVREPCKKTQSTKPPSVLTTPKHNATPMKTPTKACVNRVNKQPLATPSSVKTRMETPVRTASGGENKSTVPKWPILSAVSKSLSGYKKKLQSPTIPSPFLFRTEDRAARRKQKLEEKFNEKEAKKLQQQKNFKENADAELGRLRQTFCFKARPLPDFYKARETPKNHMKTPEANPKSFTPRSIAPSSTTSIAKRKSSRRLWNSNDHHTAQQPFSSAAGLTSHENMSPNIQHSASTHTHSKQPT